LPGNRVIDTFSDCFSFYSFSKCKSNLKEQTQKLDNLAIESSVTPTLALVITDASVKNNVTTSIAHIHIHDYLIIKTLYHTMNVISTKAKLFAIRYGINQAINTNNISKINFIMDSLYLAKKIFDPSLHPYQSHSNFILKELCNFFTWSQENTIKFWEVIASGTSTMLLTRTLNYLAPFCFFYINSCGTLARNPNVMI